VAAGYASLEIDESRTESDDGGFWARLAGTLDDEPTDIAFMTASNDRDTGWCGVRSTSGEVE
jgi:hypothetical protein